jgi:hypothetical protein
LCICRLSFFAAAERNRCTAFFLGCGGSLERICFIQS